MADNNLNTNTYLKNRLQYHAASRVAIQTGQALAQATNADGHIVTSNKVWAAPSSDFVKHLTASMKTTSDGIGANEDLVAEFKKNAYPYEAPVGDYTKDEKAVDKKQYFYMVEDLEDRYTYIANTCDEIIPGLVYCTESGGAYTVVESPEAEDLDTYYIRLINYVNVVASTAEGASLAAGSDIPADTYYDGSRLPIGAVLRNPDFPAVELYDQVTMSGVAGSNGSGSKFEAYEIVSGTSRVKDFIPPTAVEDDGSPVPGYTCRVEALKEGVWTDLENCSAVPGWALAEGNWEMIYISGMVTFHPSYTPVGQSFEAIRLTGFKYIGKYLSSVVTEQATDIATAKSDIATAKSDIETIKTDLGNIELEASKVALTGFQEALGTHTEGEGDDAVEVPNDSALGLTDTDTVLKAVVAVDRRIDNLSNSNVEGAAGLQRQIDANKAAIEALESIDHIRFEYLDETSGEETTEPEA